MYKLKAFGVIASLIDNTREVVAPVGELSPRALTYAREKEYLNSAASPGHTLVVFSSRREGEVEQTDPVLASKLLLINKWAYEQALAGAFNPSTESFRTAFIQQFGTQYSIWSIGAMTEAQPNIWMPSVIEVRNIVDDELQYRIWYVTEVFEQQFDEYQIEVVPPVADIDVFFAGSNAVKTAIAAQTHDLTMERVQEIKEGHPETFIRGEMFEWFDPIDPDDRDRRITTYWTPVIYGIAGLNIDSIKESLRDYILANSTHTKDEWAAIFPEIFTSTEFIFVPIYGKYSIPNRELESGLYSSTVPMLEALGILKDFVRGEYYTPEFIDSVAEVFGASHKAITVTVTGGPKNRDDIFTFTQRYPDYINVDSTDLDFMRMSPDTRRFVVVLGEMMNVAEGMTPDSAVPVKFSRLIRDGVLYVAYTLDRFQLIVLSKYSYNDPTLSDGMSGGEPELLE
ncbi:hypothetical protein D3C85_13640 [compost metagenome]